MATTVLPKLDPVLNAQRDRNVLTGLTSSPLQIVLSDTSVLLDRQLAHYVIQVQMSLGSNRNYHHYVFRSQSLG